MQSLSPVSVPEDLNWKIPMFWRYSVMGKIIQAVFPPTERTAFWSGKTKTDTSDFQVNKITTSQMVNTVYRTDLLVISDFAVASI